MGEYNFIKKQTKRTMKKKYPAIKRHICPYNDGNCFCECFDKGYKRGLKEVKKL